jgi:hypothetical protein
MKAHGSKTVVFRIETVGAPPRPRRGQIRVCEADETIERDAEYFRTLGWSMRSAIRLALCRYDAVLAALTTIKVPGEDNATAIARLKRLLHWHERQDIKSYVHGAKQWDQDGLPTQASWPPSDDPVVMRIRARMYRKQSLATVA